MHINNLKDYIKNVYDIENPTLDLLLETTKDGSEWIIYRCQEDGKLYFSMINKESAIHSEASPELLEELKKDE